VERAPRKLCVDASLGGVQPETRNLKTRFAVSVCH
jgi:hypothetical protein